MSICKQLPEGRFTFSKIKGQRYLWPIWAKQAKEEEKNNSRGDFLLTASPNIALWIFITAIFFKALQGTNNKKVSIWWLNIKVKQSITAHPLTEGMQKNRVHMDVPLVILLSKIITGSKISEHNLRKITLGQSLAWKHFKHNIKIISKHLLFLFQSKG